MDISELVNELQKNSIPNSWYLIGEKGITYNKTCLRLIDNQWAVFYSERGSKFDLKTFDFEDEACNELLLRMKHKKEQKKQSP